MSTIKVLGASTGTLILHSSESLLNIQNILIEYQREYKSMIAEGSVYSPENTLNGVNLMSTQRVQLEVTGPAM